MLTFVQNVLVQQIVYRGERVPAKATTLPPAIEISWAKAHAIVAFPGLSCGRSNQPEEALLMQRHIWAAAYVSQHDNS
jgi:hypothetical protein